MQAARTVSVLEAKHAVAQARLASDTIEKQPFTRNTFKCSACLRVHHAENCPMLLCDFCHRSYHTLCVPMPPGGFPQGEWACPHCVKRHEQSKLKLQELTDRKTQALKRVAEVRLRSPAARGPLPMKVVQASVLSLRLRAQHRRDCALSSSVLLLKQRAVQAGKHRVERVAKKQQQRAEKERHKAEEKAAKDELRAAEKAARDRERAAQRKAENEALDDVDIAAAEERQLQGLHVCTVLG